MALVSGLCTFLLCAGSVCAQATQETWEAIYLGGSKVGHGRTIRREVERDGQTCIETTSESQLTVKRFGQSVAQNLRLLCVETRAGQLLDFETEMTSGASRITTTGQLANGQLAITTGTKGKNTTTRLDWNNEYGGFFAAEESLRRQPLQPGQRRKLRSLLPIFNQLADIELEASDFEATSMLDGTRSLLRVNGTTRLSGGQAIATTMWVDRGGEIWKTQLAGMSQETYRTTKDIALNKPIEDSFDLGDYAVIRVQRVLRDPHRAQRIVYRARLPDQDPLSLFVSDLSQQVRSIDRHTAEIVVKKIGPKQPADRTASSPSTSADLAPNNLIQSDNPRVRDMASKIAPHENDKWLVAQALEKHVHDTVQAKTFSQALATAAEVAESLEGDCTEHAVLLAAVCRARGIPARVAIGLVHFPQQQGFAYHMWNEVWIQDRWIPLDATLGRGGIGAGHLKLAVSNLRGTTAYSAFVPVFQVLGRLQLEVVDVTN